jgi:thiamine biosynthesis lipoprotein
VLNARTGKSIEHDTVSVMVLNDNSTMADAWTALLYLHRQAGRRMADRSGISVLFITDANG